MPFAAWLLLAAIFAGFCLAMVVVKAAAHLDERHRFPKGRMSDKWRPVA